MSEVRDSDWSNTRYLKSIALKNAERQLVSPRLPLNIFWTAMYVAWWASAASEALAYRCIVH